MKFIKTESQSTIQPLRQQLYQDFVGPLDGMWESLYIAQSVTYLIQIDQNIIGYCCIDSDNCLTQIYLDTAHKYMMGETIDNLIKSQHITSAKLSSIEIVSFNACLLHSKSIENDTINYNNLIKYDDEFVDFNTNINNNGYGFAKGLDLFWRDSKSIKKCGLLVKLFVLRY